MDVAGGERSPEAPGREGEREREGQQSLVVKERDALKEQVKMVSCY